MRRLLHGRWLALHLLALVGLSVMIGLGVWQLRRLEAKRERNAVFAARLDQPALELYGGSVDADALHQRRVRLTGIFDHAMTIVLHGQPYGQAPGVHLLTPLRLRGGDQTVLIDRGWLPLNEVQPERLGAYAAPFGEVTVEGIALRSRTHPDRPPLLRVQPWPAGTRIDLWSWVEIAPLQAHVAAPLLPVYVAQLPDPAAPAAAFPRRDQVLALDEGPHAGYAFQWFAFAGMGLAVYLGLLRHAALRAVER